MQQLAVSESSKLIPYIVSSRKAVRGYLKVRVRASVEVGSKRRLTYYDRCASSFGLLQRMKSG